MTNLNKKIGVELKSKIRQQIAGLLNSQTISDEPFNHVCDMRYDINSELNFNPQIVNKIIRRIHKNSMA